MNGLAVCFLLASILYVLLFNWELLQIFLSVYFIYLILTYIFYPYGNSYNSTRKKISLTTWSEPYSPEIYSCLQVRFSKAMNFIADLKKNTGQHVTPTHLVCKAMAEVLKKFPELNTKLAFGNIVPYDTIDVSCLVAMDEGSDLGFVCFRDAGQKTLSDIAKEAETMVNSVKTGEEKKNFKKASGPFALVPTCIGGVVIEICSWISVPLGIGLPMFGIKKHPCGPACITNVGVLGAELVYAPFPTILKLPVIVVMHTIKDDIFVVNGEAVIEKGITLAVTIDHRFIDGIKAMRALDYFKEILENPDEFIKI